MRLITAVIILAIIALAAGCRSGDTSPAANTTTTTANAIPSAPPANAAPTAPASNVKAKVDVCSLLSNDDIKAVQGEPPAQSQRSDRAEGGYIIGQCYYALPTTANSIVLNLTARGEGADARDPRDFWKQSFGTAKKEGERERESDRDRDKNREAKPREGEEDEKGAEPEKIAGLGEDAYWIASRVGGALYVLKKDSFFRISVGGAGDAKTKLDKSKTLARKILPRL